MQDSEMKRLGLVICHSESVCFTDNNNLQQQQLYPVWLYRSRFNTVNHLENVQLVPVIGVVLFYHHFHMFFFFLIHDDYGASVTEAFLSPLIFAGVQRQIVHCVEKTIGIVEEHFCDPETRPDDNQTSCNRDPCPAV